MSGEDEVTSETTVHVPIESLFADLRSRLDSQDRVTSQRLDSQDKMLRRIDQRMDQSATKSDIDRLEQKYDAHLSRHDGEIADLRQKVVEDEAVKTFRERIRGQIGWVVAGIMVPLGAALIIVVATHH